MNWDCGVQGLLLYLISPAAPNKPPAMPTELKAADLDIDDLLLNAGLISAGERTLPFV